MLYEFEELRTLTIDHRWMGLILASDGVWDALSAEACWKTFADATRLSTELNEEDKMVQGLTEMIDACCCSTFWSDLHHGESQP